MTRLSLACLALLIAAIQPASAEWFADHVVNGGFEEDANQDQAPDGWTASAYRSPGAFAWDPEVFHSGHASARLSDSFSEDHTNWDTYCARWVMTSTRPAVAERTYTLRAWIKTELTGGSADVRVSWSAGNKWLHEDATERVSGTSDWRQVTVQATPPEGADTLRVFCHISDGKGSAWFDDVELVDGEATPGNYRPVDISASCTTGFADEVAGDGRGGWTDQGPNDAREIPLGRQTWRGVPFDIADPAANDGNSCVVLRGRTTPAAPERAEIPLDLSCDVLYFLHGSAWAGRAGSDVASYSVRYADGQQVDVPVRVGAEVFDWWAPADTTECAVGWEGANAESPSIALAIFPWTNPRPDARIASVTFASAGGDAVPMLVAITAGDGPPVLEQRTVRLLTTDKTGWYEWAFALDDPTLENIDVSFLLDAPAGKHGFVTVGDDGHFYFEDGTRARFFGTNVGGRGIAPPKEFAPVLAERLARFGINMLRLHVPDSKWGGLIDYTQGDSRHLDLEAFDRYDFFVAELKKRGIYVYFDLLDYRDFQVADGIPHADEFVRNWYHCAKGASYFDPTLIELQKEFATQLLTHRNPYTGNRYVDEPALAVQEITNENSLFYLSNPDLTLPVYIEHLEGLWSTWLIEQYGDRAGLAAAWTRDGVCALAADEDPAQGNIALPLKHMYDDLREVTFDAPNSPARVNAMVRFLMEIESAFFLDMTDHLRALGLKCPITGTNQDFSDASGASNAVCDFTSRNNYWRHPNVRGKPYMTFKDDAIVTSDIVMDASPIANVCSSTVEGKPMISPEFNAPWPNQYRAELLPMMAAYGRLQDWDGLLYFAYGRDAAALSCFGNNSDPARWGQVPAAALIFLRGDVSPALNTIHVGCSRVDRVSARPRHGSDHYSPYRMLPFISRVRNVYFDEVYEGDADVVISSGHSAHGNYTRAQRAIVFADSLHTDELATKLDPAASDAAIVEDDPAWLHQLYLAAADKWDLPGEYDPAEAGRVFRSDTGELVLDREAGLFTINTPNVRAAIGMLADAGTVTLGDVTVQCATRFASVMISSLDGQPIAQSGRLLLTVVSRAENTGQALTIGGTAIPEVGRAPVLVEPVDCRIVLPSRMPLRAWSLGPTGVKLHELPVVSATGTLTVDVTGARSPWILLEG